MSELLPEWASEKQKEGMLKFLSVAKEYHIFNTITFEKYNPEDSETHQFQVIVKQFSGLKEHTFRIGFDHEHTWDCYGERVQDWQFIFAHGDVARELTSEVLFMDLFYVANDKIERDSKTITTLEARVSELVAENQKLRDMQSCEWCETCEQWHDDSYVQNGKCAECTIKELEAKVSELEKENNWQPWKKDLTDYEANEYMIVTHDSEGFWKLSNRDDLCIMQKITPPKE